MTHFEKRPISARDLAEMGLLGAILFASKTVLSGLPNIEPVSLLVMVYAVVLGRKALLPIYAYVLLEYVTWGFGLWSVCYLYVWTVLALLAYLFRDMESSLGWAILSGGFGLCFGALCAIPYFVVGGWSFALSWWTQGIPFDLLHCAGNFVLALVAFHPCKQILIRLTVNAMNGGK